MNGGKKNAERFFETDTLGADVRIGKIKTYCKWGTNKCGNFPTNRSKSINANIALRRPKENQKKKKTRSKIISLQFCKPKYSFFVFYCSLG